MRSRGNSFVRFDFDRSAQHVAAAPHRLDVVLAAGVVELLAQLADEHVNDLELGLIHAAVEMIEEHLLGQRSALAQAQQFEHLVFLAGQMNTLAAVHRRRVGVEIDDEVARLDDRLRVPLGATHHRMDAGDEFVAVEWLGDVIVGAQAETLDLVLDAGEAGEDDDRGFDLADTQIAEDIETRHVGQIEVEQDDVVVIELAEVDAFLTEVGGVDVEALGLEHQLDGLSGRTVVFDEQNAHWRYPYPFLPLCKAMVVQYAPVPSPGHGLH